MNYDLICEVEEMLLDKRFIPYSAGTPKNELTENDQYDRANIVFFTDSHVDLPCKDQCIDNIKRTVEYVNNSVVKFDAVIYGGDNLTQNGLVSKEDAIAHHKVFFDMVKEFKSPLIFTKGNHEMNDWENIPENVVNDEDFNKLFLDYAEEKYNIVRTDKADGVKSPWHYFDIEDKKIRIVSVDVHNVDKTATDGRGMVKYHGVAVSALSDEQLKWVSDVALNFDDKEEKDWGVIFAMHQYTPGLSEYGDSPERLLDICKAFNEGGKFDFTFKGEEKIFDLDIKADFTRYASLEKKPHIICWFIGHEHMDKFETNKGIHMIWTRNHSGTDMWSDPHMVRYADTPTQNCFDILNIDTFHRRIRLFRYGAGITCNGVGGDRFLPDGLEY